MVGFEDEYEIHPTDLPDEELMKQCQEKRAKRSGPGGQHRNKVETAVILTHEPTGIFAEAGERRSQVQNRSKALKRLRMKLAVRHRVLRDLESGPSELWVSRCVDQKVVCSSEHRDFANLIAEAMDVIEIMGFDVKKAAGWLGCSMSQLVKFLKKHTSAMQRVNEGRVNMGMHGLK